MVLIKKIKKMFIPISAFSYFISHERIFIINYIND